jgi:hypothetical protein
LEKPMNPKAAEKLATTKTPYEPPVLVEYGDITMITRSALGGNRDGASGDDGSDDLAGTV